MTRRISGANVYTTEQVKMTISAIEYLRQRLDYNPETGVLTWKHYDAMPKCWTARYAGKEAFTANSGNGYKIGRIDNVKHSAHRIAFAIYYGRWPSDFIDHINGDGTDNRIINLREATHSQNQHNRKISKNNKSGYKGVSRNAYGWLAQIAVNGKNRRIGAYSTPELAAKAYADAAQRMHGEFSNVRALEALK